MIKGLCPHMHRKISHPLLLLHQFRRQVLMELFLLHMCCFNLHPFLQHVDIVGLSVHCREQHLMFVITGYWNECINNLLTVGNYFNFDTLELEH